MRIVQDYGWKSVPGFRHSARTLRKELWFRDPAGRLGDYAAREVYIIDVMETAWRAVDAKDL